MDKRGKHIAASASRLKVFGKVSGRSRVGIGQRDAFRF